MLEISFYNAGSVKSGSSFGIFGNIYRKHSIGIVSLAYSILISITGGLNIVICNRIFGFYTVMKNSGEIPKKR
jgi:hypothetical protein